MKGSLNDFNFIKKIEHILTYNKIIENGNLYPEIFANYFNSVIFKKYKNSANRKKFVFEITESQFKEITSSDCYICGKKNSEVHRNGIDRFDSKIGYLFYNCKSCCGECNYLKREYEYNEFIEKLKLININLIKLSPKLLSLPINNNTEKIKLENTFIPFDNNILFCNNDKEINDIPKNIVENKNKKSKEEIKENARIRKQEQRKRLIEKYGDEEYKKINAKLISENRRKKREKEI
jgi:hypothetical protein